MVLMSQFLRALVSRTASPIAGRPLLPNRLFYAKNYAIYQAFSCLSSDFFRDRLKINLLILHDIELYPLHVNISAREVRRSCPRTRRDEEG